MGFFTSRRPEDKDAYSGGTDNDKSVVYAIRSKFVRLHHPYNRDVLRARIFATPSFSLYQGKNKGKERDEPPLSFVANASPAQTLSTPGPAHPSAAAAAPSTISRGVGPSLLRTPQDELPVISSSKKSIYSTMPPPPAPASSSRSRAGPSGLRNQTSDSSMPLPPKIRKADHVSCVQTLYVSHS